MSDVSTTERGRSAGFARFAGLLPSSAENASDGPGPTLRWWLDLLDAAGSGQNGTCRTLRQCPAHPDAHPSLSLAAGADGRVLIHCHAGCRWSAVVRALSCRTTYLYEPPPVAPADYAAAFLDVTFPPVSKRRGRSPQTRGYRLDAIHDYGPDHRVLRYRNGTRKEIHWETRRAGDVWLPGLFGTPTSALPLYRETDVQLGIAAAEAVLLVESESSVDALLGWYATTWAGGAGSVQTGRLCAVLGGYPRLLVIPDHDPAGLAALDTLRAAGLVPHVLMPDPGEDARDLLGRLGTDRFRGLVMEATPT